MSLLRPDVWSMCGEDCDGIYLLVLSAELEEKVKMNSDPVDGMSSWLPDLVYA